MKRKDIKFALSILFGGFVGGLAFFIFYPGMLWLGMIAGFAGGYVAYVHRAIIVKAPVALEVSLRRFNSSMEKLRKIRKYVWGWISAPHPSIPAAIILNAVVWVGGVGAFSVSNKMSLSKVVNDFIEFPDVYGIFFSMTFIVWRIAISIMIEVGAEKEKCFYVPFGEDPEGKYFRDQRKEGLKEVPLSYRNAFRWIFMKNLFPYLGGGIVSIMMAICHGIRYLMLAFLFIVSYLCTLFVLVHKKEALLAGIFSAVGVALEFGFFRSEALDSPGKIIGALMCGIIGAAIGTIYNKTVAVKIREVLHIQTNGA